MNHIQKMQDDINYLKRLVTELLPFMLIDVKSGLRLKPKESDLKCFACRDNTCIDCQWYYQSLSWKSRIDAGEFNQFGDIEI